MNLDLSGYLYFLRTKNQRAAMLQMNLHLGSNSLISEMTKNIVIVDDAILEDFYKGRAFVSMRPL